MSKEFENGIHQISNDEYHQSNGISRSALMYLKKSPYHYWCKYIEPDDDEKKEPTPAMNLGNAVHTLTLEPHKFNDEFFVISQKTRPSKGSKPYTTMLEEANGRIILTHDEEVRASLISASVLNHMYAKQLLHGCAIEQSIYFTHELTGLQCKVRPDAMFGGFVNDLKTTNDASILGFQRSALNYGYFIQAGMCYKALKSLGSEMEEFVFIVVEKEPPYAVAIYTLHPEAIDYGVTLFDELMIKLEHCIRNDNWPGYGIKELTVPKYALYDDVVEIE